MTELTSRLLLHASIYKINLDADIQKSLGEIEWDAEGAGRAAILYLPPALQSQTFLFSLHVKLHFHHYSKLKRLFWQQGSNALEEPASKSLNLKKVLCFRVTDP